MTLIKRPCIVCGRRTLHPVLVAFAAIDGVARLCPGCAEDVARELDSWRVAEHKRLARRQREFRRRPPPTPRDRRRT